MQSEKPDVFSTEILFDPEPPEALRRNRKPSRRPEPSFGADDVEDRLIMPVAAPVRLTDTFGAPRSGGRQHQGLDLMAPRGTPVVAAAGGVIAKVSNHPRGGNCVWITSSGGSTYYYAHLDGFAPGSATGQSIRAGDLIGYVGTTGNAAGGPPHLHFEVHRDGEATNPYPLLQRAASDARGLASAAR